MAAYTIKGEDIIAAYTALFKSADSADCIPLPKVMRSPSLLRLSGEKTPAARRTASSPGGSPTPPRSRSPCRAAAGSPAPATPMCVFFAISSLVVLGSVIAKLANVAKLGISLSACLMHSRRGRQGRGGRTKTPRTGCHPESSRCPLHMSSNAFVPLPSMTTKLRGLCRRCCSPGCHTSPT